MILKYTNEELVRKIQSGEKEYISLLWSQVEDFVWRQAITFYEKFKCRYHEHALTLEDLHGEGGVIFMKSISRFDAEKDIKFITYFGAALGNRYLNVIRKRKDGVFEVSYEELTDREELKSYNSEDAFHAIETFDPLHKAYCVLTEKEKHLLAMIFGLGMAQKEIAKRECVSASLIVRRKNKALQKMRAHMTATGGG